MKGLLLDSSPRYICLIRSAIRARRCFWLIRETISAPKPRNRYTAFTKTYIIYGSGVISPNSEYHKKYVHNTVGATVLGRPFLAVKCHKIDICGWCAGDRDGRPYT